MPLSAPLSDDTFARTMAPLGPWGATPVLAVAVSGGPDSVALTWLADRWARARGGRAVGVTCDHGLRDASAGEATSLVSMFSARGIEVAALRLDIPPGPGLPARARAARFAALEAFCVGRGIVHLLVGHHAADQAETVAMRALRGSGPDGLAGIAALRELAHVRLIRPLLGIYPAALRASCLGAELPWVTDPTNADMAYLRNRLRVTTHDDRIAVDCLTARRAGLARGASERARAKAAACAAVRPEGFAVVDGMPDAALCGALVGAIGGTPYPPAAAACARLAAGAGGTLAGVRMIRRGLKTLFVREARAVAPAMAATPGALWDGRFRVGADVPEGCEIGAWGARDGRIPAAALAGVPAVRRGGTLLGDPLALDWVVFAPPRPVAPAAFVAV